MNIVAFAIVSIAFLCLESGAVGKAEALPISNTEIIEGVSGNGNGISASKVDRQKRQTNNVIRNFIQCSPQAATYVIINCPAAKWNLSCRTTMTCTNLQPRIAGWQCSQSNNSPICCDLICP